LGQSEWMDDEGSKSVVSKMKKALFLAAPQND
jgi:hypothetical protein